MAARPLIINDIEGAANALLLLEDGQRIGTLPCRTGLPITIGRTSEALIRVNDLHASRIHAVIQWDASLQTHVISDCDSTNGTYVDDVQVSSPTRLAPGSCIRIGSTELWYTVPASRIRSFPELAGPFAVR